MNTFSWMNQGENIATAERRIDPKRRGEVLNLAAERFNADMVNFYCKHKRRMTEVEFNEVWNQRIAEAVEITEPDEAL